MKHLYLLSLSLILSACGYSQVDYRQQKTNTSTNNTTTTESFSQLQQIDWQSGSPDCDKANLAPLQVIQYDEQTFLIRQSKCSHFEAPFMVLLIGDKQAVMVDTGTNKDPKQVPLYNTVKQLLKQIETTQNRNIEQVTIIHSHSHQDHHQGDAQFSEDPLFSIIDANADAVSHYFEFNQQSEFQMDLGKRQLVIFPIPGHQQESIAIFDSHTQWLISGDSFYPGKIYIQDWQSYRNSVKKMWNFSNQKQVSAIIGTHIEMSQTPGEIYPIGSNYQPEETYLPMSISELQQLNLALESNSEPVELIFERFIVTPMSGLQKSISSVVKFFVE